MDIEKIKKEFSHYSDSKIENLSVFKVKMIEPEVVQVLKNEIIKRKLSLKLIEAIDLQFFPISEDVFSEYLELVRSLQCCHCGSRKGKLRGTYLRRVRSFLFFSLTDNTPIITCEECGDKKWREAIVVTSLFGWWGFPSGIFNTPDALLNSFSDRKDKEAISQAILSQFVSDNIGFLKLKKDNEAEIINYIKKTNRVSFRKT